MMHGTSRSVNLASCSVLLASVANAGEPDYALPCVRAYTHFPAHARETFFRDMTALTYENNFDAAIPSLGTVDSLSIAEIF